MDLPPCVRKALEARHVAWESSHGARRHSEKPSHGRQMDGRAAVASILEHRDPLLPRLYLVHLRGQLILRAFLWHGLWVS